MLNCSILLLILAILSGVLGFGVESTQATIAKVCFGVFLSLFFVALIATICRRNDPNR